MQHATSCGVTRQQFDKAFTVIDRAHATYDLAILEALHIRRLRPELNTQLTAVQPAMSLQFAGSVY